MVRGGDERRWVDHSVTKDLYSVGGKPAGVLRQYYYGITTAYVTTQYSNSLYSGERIVCTGE